jgi:hypothetical protein
VPSSAGLDIDEADEENIYEVMKAHMRRQKEEQEAKNAQMRQQARMAGRPGPSQAAPPRPPAAAQRVTDLSNLAAVWVAVRQWLAGNARYFESVLGHCCAVTALDPHTGETTLRVPGLQRGFTNEKVRAKIEEGLRAVTGVGIKLAVEFTEEKHVPPPAANAGGGGLPAPATSPSVQRVPPEIIEAVKEQPVIKELMKRLDATVVQVELLGTGERD